MDAVFRVQIGGPLLLIGGAEDRSGSREVLAHFVQMAGGSAAHIAVIATASSFYEYVGQRYVDLFLEMGAARAEMLQARDRFEARQLPASLQLEQATGIFITGGDQLKLAAMLGGTPVAALIRRRAAEGCVVAGTSAGASIVSTHMIAYGASGIPPRKGMMQFAPGLALLDGVVVDQHFGARSRAGRLATAIAHNPELLGIGLDEDTAVEIDTHGMLTVFGRGSVMIVDGAGLSFTDIHNVAEQVPITIFGLHLHMLTRGYHFDLHTRQPSFPRTPPPEAAEAQRGIEGEGI